MNSELYRSVEDGDPEAQCLLGQLYYYGHNVHQDYDIAYEWFKKASDQGVAMAQFHISLMYHTGNGLPKDDASAAAWLSYAAELNDSKTNIVMDILEHDGYEAAAEYVKNAICVELEHY